MERKTYLIRSAIAILGLLHLVGLAGFASPHWYETFQNLTLYHLLTSYVLLLLFHKQWDRSFVKFLSIGFLTGFCIELAGVQTGWIFGEYHYTENMGISIFETPLLIGVNWIAVTYMTGQLAHRLMKPFPGKILLGAFSMVMFDWLLEPFAISQELWIWENNAIPLENYVAWFGISYFMQWLYHHLSFDKQNPLALPLLSIQTAFFALGWISGIW